MIRHSAERDDITELLSYKPELPPWAPCELPVDIHGSNGRMLAPSAHHFREARYRVPLLDGAAPTPVEAEAAYVVNIKNSTCHRDYAIVLRQIL
ncbi:hypothetical protein [Bosea robiniae]|uniref:hypothetical protein n=1 Tax=Bosea robiniae TaxID=1036780 RepID=UPI0011138182|nr:hypothetical protein [Bosea robiniae]